jgi:hypothetical protein
VPQPESKSPRDTLTASELRLMQRAGDFDVRALLAVLNSLGYARQDVQFRSNPENVGSRALIHSLELKRRPHPRAIVTLNLGLLGANGLLPSYFTQVVEQTADPERFYDFVGFFDHKLLDAFFSATYPESPGGLYRDFARVRRAFFHMLGVYSTSTLHWLFGLYFPELGVEVRRRPFRSATNSHALRIGGSMLDGTAVVGRTYESDAPGFTVRLSSEEEVHSNGQSWPHLVRERLERHILPEIAAFDVPLVVILRVTPHASWAQLSHVGYLGYERLRGEEDAGHQIVVFHGRSSRPVER